MGSDHSNTSTATPLSRPFMRWEDFISWNTSDSSAWNPGVFKILPPIREHDRSNFNGFFEIELPKPLEAFIEEDRFPIPVPEDREYYHGDEHFEYWVAGLRDYLKLKAAYQRYGVPDNGRTLELGCSSGRVLRQFCAQEDSYDLWAADLNFRNVAWVTTFLGNRIKAIQNSALPHLTFEDNFFDAISAFSVFTHIESYEMAWLAELRRILKPGGLAYITIMSEKLWDEMKTRAPNVYEFTKKARNPEDADRPMPLERVCDRLAVGASNTANVFVSHEYVRNVWGRLFRIEEIRVFDHYYAQDVVIMRK